MHKNNNHTQVCLCSQTVRGWKNHKRIVQNYLPMILYKLMSNNTLLYA